MNFSNSENFTQNFEIVPLFSKPVYLKDLNLDVKKIVSIAEKEIYEKCLGDKHPDDNASQSKNLYVLEHKKLKWLKDAMMREFNSYNSNVMHLSNKFEITTSWFTKMEKGQASNNHNHNNCMFSAVFYLQVDENTGDIHFQTYDTRRYCLDIEEFNVFNSVDYKFTPINNTLLLFPAEMFHMVKENTSDMTRYSLAFNLTPVGLVGEKISDSHMYLKVAK
jgi:uncharacterized protein (TIGR02466 family)